MSERVTMETLNPGKSAETNLEPASTEGRTANRRADSVRQAVTLADLDIPFARLVAFMLKAQGAALVAGLVWACLLSVPVLLYLFAFVVILSGR